MNAITKWAGLASGTGTTLDYMYEQGLRPVVVVVDRECRAAKQAEARGIKVELLPKRGKWNPEAGCSQERIDYTIEVGRLLQKYEADLGVMAGYDTILSGKMFTDKYYMGRFLNTHPALLPAFKGNSGVRDALEFGVKVTGCTVHIATVTVDDGPILGQRAVEVKPDDSEESLENRIKAKERVLYAEIVRQILAGELDLDAIWADWRAKHPVT